MALGLQQGDVTGQHPGLGLKVEVGSCLSAGAKHLRVGHETPLPAARPLSPGERERQVIAQQLPTRRKNHIVMQEGEGSCLRAKPSMKLVLPLGKKKKREARNMGINVNLRWLQALNLLVRRGMLWLVDISSC